MIAVGIILLIGLCWYLIQRSFIHPQKVDVEIAKDNTPTQEIEDEEISSINISDSEQLDDIYHNEHDKFESIWIDENVNDNYGVAKGLRDIQYIDYKVWVDMNWKSMYKKHKPNTHVMRGDNPNIIFHGGCLGCKSQRLHGVNRCKGCQYFKFSSTKPNLHIEGEDAATISGKDFGSLFNPKDDDQ